jgi:hypothetical protein
MRQPRHTIVLLRSLLKVIKKVVNKLRQFLVLEGLFLTLILKLPENNDNARQYKTRIDILYVHVYTSEVATFVLQNISKEKQSRLPTVWHMHSTNL